MYSKIFPSPFAELSPVKKVAILGLPLIAAIGVALQSSQSDLTKTIDLDLPDSTVIESILSPSSVTVIEPPTFEYQIQTGDNLSSIFTQLGFSYKSMMSVMETDLNFLALDTLRPGNTLRFWRDEATGDLSKMELQFSVADKVVYRLLEDGTYEFEDISIPGEWKQRPLVGDIHGSFSMSANKAGLNSLEIDHIVTLLKDKLNFSRDLRAGDQFEVLQKAQFVDGVATGKREIEAIKIINRNRVVSAYLHTDGQYYDADGDSLQRAFQRYPVNSSWRQSSQFNPKRLHPVTGRISPHNGTDFATPIGTPVQSTGDGKVIMTRKHPYAGNYVVIQQGSTYKTRYLHLSKILVRKGQTVSRGQRIGLSGKTGRVTGAHLHYELIERGRPVDAMKANIPMADSVPKKEKATFTAARDEADKLLKAALETRNLAMVNNASK
ncbi:peptidoglycan DD-metalloendopeptidase family protein [Vibrio sp. ED004]|uniref:peptidoglycan DD-metalloendopeptidase family protein n=1 Tax=unclassified Vibrio TaxID=2614977 RepID=UPI0002DBB3AC|nr:MULTISPECIES: peptidoglycan DD-metalloendopeptidase family protein [unclassified Vibrio]UPR59707.1 peptidoglycan DD-metalloendopeptidase family protein [Vibrio sp. ED004]